MKTPARLFRSLLRPTPKTSSSQRPVFRRSPIWLAGTALLAASAASANEHARLVDAWPAIPDQELAEMRGGLDLGHLIANFAIERLVRINGEVVARTHLVLSEIGNLANGGLPNVELAGNIASLIQVGQNNAVVLPANDPAQAAIAQAGSAAQSAVAAAGAQAAAAGAQGAAAAAAAQAQAAAAAAQQAGAPASSSGSGGSNAASQGGAGSVASVNFASGAGGSFGPALAAAMAAANGDLPGQAESNAANASAGMAGSSSSGAAPVSSAASPRASAAAAAAAGGAPRSGVASAPATGSAAGTSASSQQAGAQALSTTITVPVGNTGRSIVISNLPNAAALTTAIQNSVEAVRIDTETSISATMSSLAALRSANFAAMLRQQAIDSVRR